MASTASGKVRVVARIKGPFVQDAEICSNPWILVSRPDPNSSSSSRVKISFSSDQITSGKQSYEVDECYEQGVVNDEIFSKEIKPLISGLFGGQNCTVFAYGPRGSGKTHTVQGFEKELGLAVLTTDSVLTRAEEERKVVNVSVFEMCQDRIIDILDSKRSEVSVFEDAQGKIRLKGLSKVKVNSIEEFESLYHNAANNRVQKAAESVHRSHLGCILYLVSPQTENSSTKLVGKINFIDLASYEDSRRNSGDDFKRAETTSIKKSLTAVHNVLYALNANDRVPYRESKLTRMLQDSLGGSSKVLMIACMNPSFCQETVQTISVAARSCIAGFLAYLNPGKSGKTTNKTTVISSPTAKSASKPPRRVDVVSPKVMKPMSAASVRKNTGSRLQMSACKSSGGITAQKSGRKLFADNNQAKTPKREKILPVTVPVPSTDSSAQEAISSLDGEVTAVLPPQLEEKSTETAYSDVNSSQLPSDKETSKAFLHSDSSQLPLEEDGIQAENKFSPPCIHKTPTAAGRYLLEDIENKYHDELSPPLSTRLQELSNNLKSMCVSKDANFKTPTFCPKVSENHEISNNESPWTNLHAVKDNLVQEYLKFLNTADKEELKGLKGIGEQRANYIVELREERPEPFKELDDLKDIGLSQKQITGLMKNIGGNLFT